MNDLLIGEDGVIIGFGEAISDDCYIKLHNYKFDIYNMALILNLEYFNFSNTKIKNAVEKILIHKYSYKPAKE